MERTLIEAYKQIFKFKSKNNEPSWAVHKELEGHTHELVHCSIPFVGKNYAKQKVKILLYASSENLANYGDKEKLYRDELAVNRHRHYYNESVLKADRFFPDVHIAPISDGSLLTVALYICTKLVKVGAVTPKEFLEIIAFGNYSKYSEVKINGEGEKNIDPARDARKLEASHEYIRKDIEVLKPDYIIMFSSIYNTDRKFINSVKRNAQIIDIYQINARTINTTINIKDEKYTVDKNNIEKHLGKLEEIIKCWYKEINDKKISGDIKKNYLSVFPYIDDVLREKGILG
ncbi:MAG: hypothetical protein IJ320_08785 [Phascolarctobacterium sp.]|nr:hypothetical protein [Phascolarctobacterium sp.]